MDYNVAMDLENPNRQFVRVALRVAALEIFGINATHHLYQCNRAKSSWALDVLVPKTATPFGVRSRPINISYRS